MTRTFIKYIKKSLALTVVLVIGYFAFNSIKIYQYSHEYFEDESDVAIVLGAGTHNNQASPVFKERINHAIYLYNKRRIKKVIFTGGFGNGQSKSDSRIAKEYAVNYGVSEKDILIEESSSRYTIENLRESKELIDSLGYETALLISDPLHMKRSMVMAQTMGINCKPSPTKTSMYRSAIPKLNSLFYETFFFSAGQLAGKH